MNKIICRKCKKYKDKSNFYKSKYSRGVLSECIICTKKTQLKNYRSINGLTGKIYRTQKATSKRRGHKLPDYTLIELRKWILIQPNFYKLYNDWIESVYSTNLIPSCDRLDDYKPYTLSNLRLVTWKINNDKGRNDMRNGINNKNSKAVIQFNKSGDTIKEYYSIAQAKRETGINDTHISLNCLNKRISAGGFVWKYKSKQDDGII